MLRSGSGSSGRGWVSDRLSGSGLGSRSSLVSGVEVGVGSRIGARVESQDGVRVRCRVGYKGRGWVQVGFEAGLELRSSLGSGSGLGSSRDWVSR